MGPNAQHRSRGARCGLELVQKKTCLGVDESRRFHAEVTVEGVPWPPHQHPNHGSQSAR